MSWFGVLCIVGGEGVSADWEPTGDDFGLIIADEIFYDIIKSTESEPAIVAVDGLEMVDFLFEGCDLVFVIEFEFVPFLFGFFLDQKCFVFVHL